MIAPARKADDFQVRFGYNHSPVLSIDVCRHISGYSRVLYSCELSHIYLVLTPHNSSPYCSFPSSHPQPSMTFALWNSIHCQYPAYQLLLVQDLKVFLRELTNPLEMIQVVHSTYHTQHKLQRIFPWAA